MIALKACVVRADLLEPKWLRRAILGVLEPSWPVLGPSGGVLGPPGALRNQRRPAGPRSSRISFLCI